MSASRYVAKGGNCLGPGGEPDGAACLASDWGDKYFATIKNFIERHLVNIAECSKHEATLLQCFQRLHTVRKRLMSCRDAPELIAHVKRQGTIELL